MANHTELGAGSAEVDNDLAGDVSGKGVVSEEVYAIIDTVINCVLVNIIAIFGIIGNAMTITVLRRHGIGKDTTNILLAALSSSDLIFSLTLPIRRSRCLLSYIDEAIAITVDAHIRAYFYNVNHLCLIISVNLIGAISVERFVAVYFPFKVAQIFTPFRTKIVVFGILIYNLCLFCPLFHAYEYEWVFLERLNQTVAVTRHSTWWSERARFFDFYFLIICNNLLATTNMSLVFFCGLAIAIKLAQGAKARQKLTNKDGGGVDIRVVKMLFLVCGICFLVFVPTTVIDMIAYFNPSIYQFVQYFCDLLYAINASVNFIIYVSMSKKFSDTYKSIFCSCFSK